MSEECHTADRRSFGERTQTREKLDNEPVTEQNSRRQGYHCREAEKWHQSVDSMPGKFEDVAAEDAGHGAGGADHRDGAFRTDEILPQPGG